MRVIILLGCGNVDNAISLCRIDCFNQKFDVTFAHDSTSGGHAEIAEIIISRLYGDHKEETLSGNQSIYDLTSDKGVVFVLFTTDMMMFLKPSNKSLSSFQYETSMEIAEEVKKTDFGSSKGAKCIFSSAENLQGDKLLTIEDPERKLDNMLANITESIGLSENLISRLDFSGCKSDDEIFERAEVYARNIDKKGYNIEGNVAKSL